MRLGPLRIELPWQQLGIVAIAACALFSIMQLPTANLLGGLAARLPWLQLAGLSGGPWSGDAEALRVRVAGKWLSLGRLHWQLQPPSLLPPRIALQLQSSAEGRSFSTQLSAGGGQISLHRTRAMAPAAIAHHWLPPETALAGSLFLRAEHLTVGRPPALRELQLVWRDARLSYRGTLLALGELQIFADAMAEDGAVTGRFENSGGDVSLVGSWQWQAGQWQLEGTLTATAELSEAAQQLLRDGVGPAHADGSHHFQFSL